MSLADLGRQEERKLCDKPGCKTWCRGDFCKEHSQHDTSRYSHDNIVPRHSDETGEQHDLRTAGCN
jgi:hypothetical protein